MLGMTLIGVSLVAWWYLIRQGMKGPKINVPWRHRGGGGGGETTVTSHTYYYYRIKFPHNSIDPSQEIIFYDAFGEELYRLPPNYQFMNYSEGILAVPGTEQNTQVESVSTATYYVFYSTDDLIIDYENAEFKIAKKLIKSQAQSIVKGTFEYITVLTPFKDVASVIDGRHDTQCQTVFYSEPPTGYNYAILDLGAEYNIQAFDVVAGFFKPDDYRKFDISMNLTIQYSTDGVTYSDISDETNNFALTGGESKSFEEQDLGVGFSARYLKLIIEDVGKIDYSSTQVIVSDSNRQNLIDRGLIDSSTANGTKVVIRDGIYVIAISEISAYNNIILKSEATLISTTQLTANANPGDMIVWVTSTSGFSEPQSAEAVKAYIDGLEFTYTGLTATSFTGCVLESGVSGVVGDRVSQDLEDDTTVYDDDGLLPLLKDRVYKNTQVSDEYLYTQDQLDYVCRRYLLEFIKNHSKVEIEVLYAPHLQVGQTIKLVDTYNNTSDNYFIESIKDNNGFYSLTIAKYPA